VLGGVATLADVLSRKQRAAEENAAFIPAKDLYA
jgi:hypothetical protein